MKSRGKRVIAGRIPVRQALLAGVVKGIYLADGATGQIIEDLVALAKKQGVPIERVSGEILGQMVGAGVKHQGVAAIADEIKTVEVEDILDIARSRNEDAFVLLLDGIEDPRNLGAILRTADSAGVHGVVIPKRRAAGLTPLVFKAAAGAAENIAIAQVSNIAYTIDALKKKGVWIVGVDEAGDEPYWKADFKRPLALVIGGEGKGIHRLVKSKCDFTVMIPMKGSVESLNASVAAALVMYETVRQRTCY